MEAAGEARTAASSSSPQQPSSSPSDRPAARIPSSPNPAMGSSSCFGRRIVLKKEDRRTRRPKNCCQKNYNIAHVSIVLAALFIHIFSLPMVGTWVAHGHGESSSRAVCLERINAGYYIDMARFRDGSGRVLLVSKDSKIWQATMPKHGTTLDDGKAARTTLFLDPSDIVQHGADGLEIKGIEVHPEFAKNGRFFLSYFCSDRSSSKQRRLVVAEFISAQDSKGMTKTAENPREVKTIFSMELPQEVQLSSSNQGGQIFFEHANNTSYLYIVIGHGVIKSAGGYDVLDLSWDKSKLLGKVIRVEMINYPPGVPEKSPQPEIVAMGVSDPQGCSIDTDDRQFMYCSLVNGTAQVRLIDIESGRYTLIYHGRLPEITGGFKYDGASTDPSLEGRYIYSYNSSICTVTETPKGSGHYTSARIAMVGCSVSSPMACDPNSFAIAGFIRFIREDSNGDALFFTPTGIYRVVHPALCHYLTVDGEPVDDGDGRVGKHRSPAHSPTLTNVLVFGGIPVLGLGLFVGAIFTLWAWVTNTVGGGQQAPSLTVNNNCSCFNTGT